MSDADLKNRLDAVTQTVVDASAQFELAAAAGMQHSIATHTLVGTNVTKAEMEKVYTGRMAAKAGPGRSIYDEIISMPAHGRCPLCAHRNVTTLDHHMPKAHFPSLAVAPLNLIPACSDCNKLKSQHVAQTADEVPLHPYFDNIDGAIWLNAAVVQTAPSALRFRAEPPAAWGAVLRQRVINHFASLRLATLYASQAAEELLNIRHQLTGLDVSGGADAVRAWLEECADSRQHARLNGWATAAYTAWAGSDWFCSGGYA